MKFDKNTAKTDENHQKCMSKPVPERLLHLTVHSYLTQDPPDTKNDVQKMFENLPHNVEHSGHP